MLQNDFYHISKQQIDENSINATLQINAAHHIFAGHFPDHPVVPGVCMMQMVKEILETLVGKNCRLIKAHEMKFLSLIDPMVNNTIHLDLKNAIGEDDQYIVSAVINFAETTFFKFKGIFTAV